ncbi:3-hydroxybutyrate dehydrogenase [Gimibacter soli]|uniref:3-hydroxybutyrate dehydrogenase n=1 Tax=Gimibacter soli TaxID=3024400 RepID=A0AAE9XXC5_9PROT|nr:3-hydroxybutyrate dehydrogenase [Gimibacter soli]WCL55344.1 3-hydroxybutyrate dehydrogenase [Gimibacter soli]
MKPLSGKVALITGSTSGIGLGIARGLAEAGASVVLNGFGDPAEIERIKAAIKADFGVEAGFIGADLMKGEEATRLVTEAEAAFGAVDILVNNAGIQHVAAIDEFPVDKWEAIIALNLSATFYATRAALPGMRKRGFGRVINIASVHGLVASPFKSAYVAAKHGVVGFTKTAALETAEDQNLTVNAICPGYVRTPLVDGQIADQAKVHGLSEEEVVKRVILASQPNKRFVEVEELAALAVFLASDAGRSTTGSSLTMDGAWTAR